MTKTLSRFARHLALLASLPVAMVGPHATAQILQFNEAAEVAAAHMGVERVAPSFLPTFVARADSNTQHVWVQLDLGSEQTIDSIKLLPSPVLWGAEAGGFPDAYKIEVSHEARFESPIVIEDRTFYENDLHPSNQVLTFATMQVRARYVRFTATRLRDRKLCLGRIMVLQGERDLAVGATATTSVPEQAQNLASLTTPHRPEGEFVVHDRPEDVIPESAWRPVRDVVQTPLTGISLKDGLLRTVMQNNVDYLLHSFTKEELVRNFKEKAGLPCAPVNPAHHHVWMRELPGSEAGRFLMGAGNTLRWQEDKPLRDEMDYIVSVIDSCKEQDGWLMAFRKHEMFESEYGAYSRAWVSHGLIDAGYAGNKRAFALLRGFYDYMDRSPFLPEMLRRCRQGQQGAIPFTRTYFSPVGKAADLQVVMRYYQQNFWMEGLAARRPESIWLYPYDRPHNYMLTAIEPYFDLYRATGAKKYLDAVQGAWHLFHDNWETTGGGLAINEGSFLYEPKSYWLHKQSGELCGNVFWIKINQRFHNLYPDEEKYAAEIEKSIFNVGIANQVGAQGIRYFARLDLHKDGEHNPGYGFAANTCCEGQGTRLYGSLPEYLYSFAPDGLYINLYGASTVSLPLGGAASGQTLALDVSTAFPYDGKVAIKVTQGAHAKLHLRIPAWTASKRVAIRLNGKTVAQGRAGTYCTLERTWREGDVISFSLPMTFRTTLYTGKEPGFEQGCYAVEYGPILMAAVGAKGKEGHVRLNLSVKELARKLRPVAGRPLHFTLEGENDYELWPYFEVQEEPFSCFPQFK